MKISKYDASGNDFVVTHAFGEFDWPEVAKRACDRHHGVGADGLVVLLPHSDAHMECRFFNCDGSAAAMCGNGSRAAAHYGANHVTFSNEMRLATEAGAVLATVDSDQVAISFPRQCISSRDIADEGHVWWAIDTGLRHLVTLVDDVDRFDVTLCRELAARHDAHIDFVEVVDQGIKVRSFELGVDDETLACGTGMAAAFLRVAAETSVADPINVYPRSGERLAMRREQGRLFCKGAVRHVFDTTFEVGW